MELKDFIKNTINDIRWALKELQEENNTYYLIASSNEKSDWNGSILFDLSVTTETKEISWWKAGIKILELNKWWENFNSNVSKIKFEVKVWW